MPIDIAALFAILAPYYPLLCKFSENRRKIAPFGYFQGEEGNNEDLQEEVKAFEKEVTESLHKCLCDQCHEKNDPNYTADECSRHNSENVDFEWVMVPMRHGVLLAPYDGYMRGYSTFFVVTGGMRHYGKMFLLQTDDQYNALHKYAKGNSVTYDAMDYVNTNWPKASNADVFNLLEKSVEDCTYSDRSNEISTFERFFLGRVEGGV